VRPRFARLLAGGGTTFLVWECGEIADSQEADASHVNHGDCQIRPLPANPK
jgi:hypothetical protein